MYTAENYYSSTSKIDFSSLPEALRKGHAFVDKVTGNGAEWTNYHNSATIKKTINTYFEKLGDYIADGEKVNLRQAIKKAVKAVKENNHVVVDAALRKQGVKKTKKSSAVHLPAKVEEQALLVERVPDEVRFIKRFVGLHGRTKTKAYLLGFINSLQKAIVEKRIRKTSGYAEQIRFIQERLIETYNCMKKEIVIQLKSETLEALRKIGFSEKMLVSIGFIKRYIGLNEKPDMRDRARKLLLQINSAYEKGKIMDSDPYIIELHEIKKNLENFIGDRSVKVLEIEKATLNGLEGIINGCNCGQLNGIDGADKPTVMNSLDFAKMEFHTIGLKGKWFDLIGDPSSNFTAMVYGKPKMGKSYLCIDFAGYLAQHHGKVLYVAKEEGLDYTLQQKLTDKNVQHPNLDVASQIPQSLAKYDFIFLDSVNKLGLQPEDLTRLKAQYPGKSFIYVFQSTKDGNFRGENSFQHDVDVVIEVPEKGRAVQFGRFNQGGEISIF